MSETNREGGTIHQFDLKVCSVLLRIERLVGNAGVLFNRITTRHNPGRNAHRRIIASYIDLSIRKQSETYRSIVLEELPIEKDHNLHYTLTVPLHSTGIPAFGPRRRVAK